MSKLCTQIATIAATCAFSVAGTATGQEKASAGHAHPAPHGGDIVEVADHHVEFKADTTGSLFIWLLDEQQKTVAPPEGATVTLMGSGGSQVTLPLRVDRAAQRLVGQFDARTFHAFQAVVSLSIAGTRRNVRFRYPARH